MTGFQHHLIEKLAFDEEGFMEVTIRQLRYFAGLARDLNYRRAAQSMFVTQPALSTAIKQLEGHLGAPLFVRNTRRVQLTDLAAAWLPSVQGALDGLDAAIAEFEALARRQGGHLRLGYLIGTGADLLFKIVHEFEDAHPSIRIEATEFDFSDPTSGLHEGLCDVALVRPPVDLPGHRMVVLSTESWVACLPHGHPLTGEPAVEITALLDEPIVCAPESAGIWRDYWMATDAREGRPAAIAGVASTYEAETTLVSRGLGISFTTDATARLYQRQGVSYVPIRGRGPTYTALAWNPDSLSVEADAMVRLARRRWVVGNADAEMPLDLCYR